jgi:hypothetical protein
MGVGCCGLLWAAARLQLTSPVAICCADDGRVRRSPGEYIARRDNRGTDAGFSTQRRGTDDADRRGCLAAGCLGQPDRDLRQAVRQTGEASS